MTAEERRAYSKRKWATDPVWRAKQREAQRRYRARRNKREPGWQRASHQRAWARIKADPVRLAEYRARHLAQWHARKARPDGPLKEAQRREYKRRRYHEVYKKSAAYMARKRAYDRDYQAANGPMLSRKAMIHWRRRRMAMKTMIAMVAVLGRPA